MEKELQPRLEVQRQAAGADHPGLSVLQVTGDLDAANAQILREALVATIDDSEGGGVVADLTHVNYIDSVGLGTLVSGLKRANEHNIPLRFVVTNPQILKVLHITGLVRLLEIYETREAAVAGKK